MGAASDRNAMTSRRDRTDSMKSRSGSLRRSGRSVGALVGGVLGLILVVALCAPFIIGLLRTRADMAASSPTIQVADAGHWTSVLTIDVKGSFDLALRPIRGSAPSPVAPPEVTLQMAACLWIA